MEVTRRGYGWLVDRQYLPANHERAVIMEKKPHGSTTGFEPAPYGLLVKLTNISLPTVPTQRNIRTKKRQKKIDRYQHFLRYFGSKFKIFDIENKPL